MRDIFFALAERWEAQSHATDAIVEILAETSASHFRLHVVRCPAYQARGNAGTVLSSVCAWKYLQQLVLALRSQASDFIQVQGARAIKTTLAGDSPEKAFSIELRTTQSMKRLFPTNRELMNALSRRSLTRTTLRQDQDRYLTIRELLDDLFHGFDRWTDAFYE